MSHIINYRLKQFSWAVAAVLLLPLLFTQGMFFDGLNQNDSGMLSEGLQQSYSNGPKYIKHRILYSA